MATKRFLNVEYKGQPDRVNITDMEDLSQVRDKVKEKYAFERGSAYIQLWKKTGVERILIDDLDYIPNEYFLKRKDGGFSLIVDLLPSPKPSPQASELNLEGIDNFQQQNSAKKREELNGKYQRYPNFHSNPNRPFSNLMQFTCKRLVCLVLYCRPTFHDQFKFLRERVVDKGVLAWIVGPPGTGKSTTALAFASTIDRTKWVVTWIHLSRYKYPVCVRLEGELKKSMVVTTAISTYFLKF